MKRGHFFTFEGIDGCGKSTQLARVADALRSEGMACVVTREPGGEPISELIREILISPDNGRMRFETECLLYLAARAQHVRAVIAPAVEAGKIVLCDRFEQATFAYQGYGRGLDLSFLRTANNFASDGLSPDITFIFDIPVSVSAERLSRINKGKDRIESAGPEFFERVRSGYLAAAQESPDKIKLLDGSGDVGALTDEILGVVFERVKQ